MGVPSTTLRVSGGEDGVDKDKGANDLSRQAGAGAVTGGELIGTTAVAVVVGLLEGLH